MNTELNRRRFLQTSAGLAAAGLSAGGALPAFARLGVHNGAGKIKVGVIGCGGRGTGAANDILTASQDTVIVSLGDMFEDRVRSARENLAKQSNGRGERVQVNDGDLHTGFDAYKKVLASGVDVVILATPPGFRPVHFKAAIDAGKHVFFEKPVAVDPGGVRMVIDAAQIAQQKKLSVVTGTQRRHQKCYLEALQRVQDGGIGKVLSANVYWNQGALWSHPRSEFKTDMEWQLRNWLYFTWLSGDHIVEQHVHNLDAMNWVMGATPVKCMGMGGRQVRTGAEFGHIFDHFAIEYEYPDGVIGCSQCRQIVGCADRVSEQFSGEKGRLFTADGQARIKGEKAWAYAPGTPPPPSPYVQEHIDFVASLTGSGPYLNEGVRVAESTLTAIMGRMSAYTGKEVSWEQALNSKLNLMPEKLELGSIATPEVAVPGKTQLV